MSNAYKAICSGEYKHFRVWRYGTSVPWPMAFGSFGARLVCSPAGTVSISFSSVLIANSYTSDSLTFFSLYVAHLRGESTLGFSFFTETKT
jgi:hypothetical protein